MEGQTLGRREQRSNGQRLELTDWGLRMNRRALNSPFSLRPVSRCEWQPGYKVFRILGLSQVGKQRPTVKWETLSLPLLLGWWVMLFALSFSEKRHEHGECKCRSSRLPADAQDSQ